MYPFNVESDAAVMYLDEGFVQNPMNDEDIYTDKNDSTQHQNRENDFIISALSMFYLGKNLFRLFIRQHNKYTGIENVTFFGGEPLLNFDLIKYIIN